jgi:uncharacterized membrane protein YdjX (TVP38/TMEM64 family)
LRWVETTVEPKTATRDPIRGPAAVSRTGEIAVKRFSTHGETVREVLATSFGEAHAGRMFISFKKARPVSDLPRAHAAEGGRTSSLHHDHRNETMDVAWRASDQVTERDREPGAGAKRSGLWRFAPLAVVVAGLALGYGMGWHRYFSLMFLAESRDALNAYVAENYLLSLLGFGAVYALAVAFAFPAASVLTIFGGFLFGWLVGGSVVAVAATIGATALFLAARSAFGDFLRERVGGKSAAFADGFEENAFGYLLVLRLAPIFPFFLVNIAPALFMVPLRTYVGATLLGILPGVFAYSYLGEGIDSVLTAARESGQAPSAADLVTPKITLAFAALALVAAIPVVVRKIRKRRSI